MTTRIPIPDRLTFDDLDRGSADVRTRPAEPAVPPTFARLCELEPRLAALAERVVAVAAVESAKECRCANAVWYGYADGTDGLRGELSALVGWDRGGDEPADETDALLKSEAAYDVAYDALYELLPDCRNCGCL